MQRYKARDNKTGDWFQDGDLFSKGDDYTRKYECRVTNHGILYTKTHLDTDDSIVQGIDGREGYTDWDHDCLYTDVTTCMISEFNYDKHQITEGDLFKLGNLEYVVKFQDGAFQMNHTKKEYGIGNNNRWGLLSRLFDADMEKFLDEIELIGNIHDKTKSPC